MRGLRGRTSRAPPGLTRSAPFYSPNPQPDGRRGQDHVAPCEPYPASGKERTMSSSLDAEVIARSPPGACTPTAAAQRPDLSRQETTMPVSAERIEALHNALTVIQSVTPPF